MLKYLWFSLAIASAAHAVDWRFVGAEANDTSLFFVDISKLKHEKTFQVFTTLQIQKFPSAAEEGGGRSVYTDMVADCEMHLTGIESATVYDSHGRQVSAIKPRDIVFTKPVSESINDRWLAWVCGRQDQAATGGTVDPLAFALKRWATSK